MFREVPLALGGPVSQWELVRAARQPWARLLRWTYLGLVAVVVLRLAFIWDHVDRFAASAVWMLLQIQAVVIVLITPLVCASAFGPEKERDTLTALFATELRAREIVVGKLIARLTLVAQMVVVALPVFVVLAYLGNIGMDRLFFVLIAHAVLAFALGAACVLVSIWTERTSDALLGCYASLVIAVLVVPTFLGSDTIPAYLKPVIIASKMASTRQEPVDDEVWIHIAVCIAFGLACLTIAIWRLRKACLAEADARPLPSCRIKRPSVGDDPFAWRECYVIGLSPIPWLRKVPRSFAVIIVFLFSALLAARALENATPRGPLFLLLVEGDFDQFEQKLQRVYHFRIAEGIEYMGCLLIAFAAVVITLRLAFSIPEEKRRKTWDDLTLTPWNFEEIWQCKRRGVERAMRPYLVAYALPMATFGMIGGLEYFLYAALWITAAILFTYGVAPIVFAIPVMLLGLVMGAPQVTFAALLIGIVELLELAVLHLTKPAAKDLQKRGFETVERHDPWQVAIDYQDPVLPPLSGR